MDVINDLICRLNEAIVKMNISNRVYDVYFDKSEDIVTIILYQGIDIDKVEFYTRLESSGFLKKNDQIAINWL